MRKAYKFGRQAKCVRNLCKTLPHGLTCLAWYMMLESLRKPQPGYKAPQRGKVCGRVTVI